MYQTQINFVKATSQRWIKWRVRTPPNKLSRVTRMRQMKNGMDNKGLIDQVGMGNMSMSIQNGNGNGNMGTITQY